MNADVDNDKEIVQLLLNSNEWDTFDCKRAAIKPSKLMECVNAFANTAGGIIVLGMEDPKKTKGIQRLVGISENLSNISEVLKLISKEFEPPLKTYKYFRLNIINTYKKKDELLVLSIDKSNDIHSLKNGDTFIRKGDQNIKIGGSEIIRLKYERGSLKYEDEMSKVCTLDDIDDELLEKYKQDTESKSNDTWQFLKDNGLAVNKKSEYCLTNAGVLLFGKNPSILLRSKSGIKISHYYGNEPSYTGEPNLVRKPITIEGPLIKQIEEAIKYFKSVITNSPIRLKESGFTPTFLIPEWAYQEAITNAVIHRNYAIQNDIQVRFFDNRIEIESPGTYPGHITTSNIRSERYSRNPIILRTLNRFVNSPNLDIGEGVDRMYKLMREKYLYDPLFYPATIFPNFVRLILFNTEKTEYWDSVSNFLDKNLKISNKEARKITGITDTIKMSRLLKMWVSKGLLVSKNEGYKGNNFYSKPGVNLSKLSFSNNNANGSDI